MTEELRKILVAYDGSSDSAKATRLACALARKFGSTVMISFVYTLEAFAYGGATPVPMPDLQPIEQAAKSRGKSILEDGLRIAQEEGINASGELIEARSTVQALVDLSSKEKVDLIVVGTRGMTGFKKLIMGSVSSGLTSHAECPVLVVR